MKAQVSTINGKKPIGEYNPQTKTYSKWVFQNHRLWKAGGAFTVDKSYLDDIWPDCEWVSEEREILEYGVKTVGKTVDIKRRNITEKMRRLQKQLENLNGTADI